MRAAIIADIHGNSLALEAVLQEVKREGVDLIFALGDYVGYYYHPQEVFNLLEGFQLQAVKGNHDQMLLNIFKGDKELKSSYKKKYGCGIDIALEKINNAQMDYISKLSEKKSLTIKGKKIMLCHGSPWDMNEYIYPDSSVETCNRFVCEDCDLAIMGHTHYPMLKRIGSVLLVNPGSVGQPRTAPRGAQWALLDLDSLDVKLKTTSYNIAYVADEASRINPEIPYLSNILLKH